MAWSSDRSELISRQHCRLTIGNLDSGETLFVSLSRRHQIIEGLPAGNYQLKSIACTRHRQFVPPNDWNGQFSVSVGNITNLPRIKFKWLARAGNDDVFNIQFEMK